MVRYLEKWHYVTCACFLSMKFFGRGLGMEGGWKGRGWGGGWGRDVGVRGE